MPRWSARFQLRSLRARFAIACCLLLALATVNIGAFYWGAQQRDRQFHALRGAITRHSALTELRAPLPTTFLFDRGDHTVPKQAVKPGTPAVLAKVRASMGNPKVAMP